MGKSTFLNIISCVWKSIVTGIGYVVSCMVAGMALQSMGAKLPEVIGDMGSFIISFFISGALLAAFMGPVIMQIKLPVKKTFLILSGILFLNSASVVIEAAFFTAGIISMDVLPSILQQQLIISLGTALIIALLFRPGEKQKLRVVLNLKWHQWIGRLILSAISYVVFYYIFGRLNYWLFTGAYYEANLSGLTIPSAINVLRIESIRAFVIVLSIIPFVMFSAYSRKRKIILSGLILFVVGGLVPLLSQINTLPLIVVISSLFEIFLQNFLTGAVTAFLFSEKTREQTTASIKYVAGERI